MMIKADLNVGKICRTIEGRNLDELLRAAAPVIRSQQSNADLFLITDYDDQRKDYAYGCKQIKKFKEYVVSGWLVIELDENDNRRDEYYYPELTFIQKHPLLLSKEVIPWHINLRKQKE